MTGIEVYDLLQAVKEATEGLIPGMIILDPMATLTTSTTTYKPDGTVVVRLGVQDFQNNPEELHDAFAAEPVVKLLHEVCGHVGQEIYEFTKDTPLTRILGLNCVACRSSEYYYLGRSYADAKEEEKRQKAQVQKEGAAGNGRNVGGQVSSGNKLKPVTRRYTKEYSRQPFELAAQYMAFKAVHNYLLVACKSPERAEKMLMSYAELIMRQNVGFAKWDDVIQERNTRLGGKKPKASSWLENNCRDANDPEKVKDLPVVTDVLGALDKKFKKCIFSKREHRIFADAKSPMAKACDPTCSYRLSSEQIDIFEACSTGVHQDLMVCAVAYHDRHGTMYRGCDRRSIFMRRNKNDSSNEDKDVVLKPFGNAVFRRLSWDYENIFTYSFPNDLLTSSRWNLSQLHNMMRDIPDGKKRIRPSWMDDESFSESKEPEQEVYHKSSIFAQYQNAKPSDKPAKPKGPDLSL